MLSDNDSGCGRARRCTRSPIELHSHHAKGGIAAAEETDSTPLFSPSALCHSV